jgi:catechol 2,3-dioxygenase-like lactoylglutathione lyase family enzyme
MPNLSQSSLVAFVPIADGPKALAFYRDKLGLTLVEDQTPFALVFDANGIMIRATFAGGFQPHLFTVLGWRVANIETSVRELKTAGVYFNRYPGMNDTDALGIWSAPGGIKVAWFNDPFGNVLSLQQDAATPVAP